MKKKSGKPKPVSYELITPSSDRGHALYPRLQALVDAHHPELREARIALAWCTSWKMDVDGALTLGRCKKASDLDRELAAFDFVVLLNQAFWQDVHVTDVQRTALLDHELSHADVALDARGEPKIDSRGRQVYRLRKHDLEEFTAIAARYGCWKRDLEAFATALDRARQARRFFLSPETLQPRLREAGASVSLAALYAWTDAERRDAKEWADLRLDPTLLATPPACPPHLLAAMEATPSATT